MNNSVKQIAKYLDTAILASEGRIQREVFGYYRNESTDSNKKYADMLRRGWSKGYYTRVWVSVPGVRSKVFYYKGTLFELTFMLERNKETLESFILKNEL
jgi:hypothetical protein